MHIYCTSCSLSPNCCFRLEDVGLRAILLLSGLHTHRRESKQCLDWLFLSLCNHIRFLWPNLIIKVESKITLPLTERVKSTSKLTQTQSCTKTGNQTLNWNQVTPKHIQLFIPPFSRAPSWANTQSKLTYQGCQDNRNNTSHFKTIYQDGMRVVYRCSSKYVNLGGHGACYSPWYSCVLIWASWNTRVGFFFRS